MARRPQRRAPRPVEPPLSLLARAWALIKRNPVKSATAALGLLAVVPGGIAGASYLGTATEPWRFAQHYWVRDSLSPFIKVQGDHETYLNYLKLRDARGALKDAKEDLAKTPTSVTDQRAVEYYEDLVRKYQEKIGETPQKGSAQ